MIYFDELSATKEIGRVTIQFKNGYTKTDLFM